MKRIYPTRPIVAASPMVLWSGKVLLVRRRLEPSSGMWSFPGGVIELGETARDTAAREAFEECGIKIKVCELLGNVDSIFHDEKNQVMFHYVILVFRSEYLSGDIHNCDEHEETRWMPLSATGNYKLTRTASLALNWCGAISS
ncbi:MAG: putative mutator protein MutT4 [Pelotomaculum sp. PtaU1.Bin035]|nr:MAG: putative mutator protein MutT4 [Pelotomaculum sp. PtaU1.Bin035]